MPRAAALLAAMLATAMLGGCGVLFVARQGSKLYSEISHRNEMLARQRETMRAQLWPELQARCRRTPDLLPAGALHVTHVAFDEATATLVSDDALRALPDHVEADRVPLHGAPPADEQALVFLDSAVLRSEPALTLAADTLRIEDPHGHLLGRETQFAFDWQAQTSTEFRTCAELLAQPSPPAAEPPARPDLQLLGRAFGTR